MPPVPVPTSSDALVAADAGLDAAAESAPDEPALVGAPDEPPLVGAAPEVVLPELHAASRAAAAAARAASRSGRGRRVTMVLLGICKTVIGASRIGKACLVEHGSSQGKDGVRADARPGPRRGAVGRLPVAGSTDGAIARVSAWAGPAARSPRPRSAPDGSSTARARPRGRAVRRTWPG